MSQIWNAQFVFSTQHKGDDETRYGGTQRSERCCWGTSEEFSRNSTALRRLVHYPGSATDEFRVKRREEKVEWQGRESPSRTNCTISCIKVNSYYNVYSLQRLERPLDSRHPDDVKLKAAVQRSRSTSSSSSSS